MAKPAYTLKMSRKDKEPIDFKDHKGESKTNRYRPIGALFANDFGGFNLNVDENGPLGKFKEDYYFSVFANDSEDGGGKASTKKSKPADDDMDF